jgi:hypothetical protein
MVRHLSIGFPKEKNSMRGIHISHIAGLSFAGCLLLQASAVAMLLFARKNSRLKSVGGAILSYSSWVVVALPGFILAGLLMENLNPLALTSYIYPIGAGTLCVMISLYLNFE